MLIRFKLDENLPRSAEHLLVALDMMFKRRCKKTSAGTPTELIAACQRERRVLVTFDLDFSDIRSYPPEAQRGVWILRPATQSVANTLALLRGALHLSETEPADGRLWILEHNRVRIRS